MRKIFLLLLVMGLGLSGNALADRPAQSNLSDDVYEITCDTGERIIGGMKFTFINVNAGFQYRVSAIGINGFDPVIAVVTSPGFGSCNDDFSTVAGSQVAVPGVGLVTADGLSSQVEIFTGNGGNIDVVVGGFAGSTGQFAMVVENLQVNPASDLDGFMVTVPQVIAAEPVNIFMVARDGSGLDPYLYAYTGEGLYQNPIDLNNVSLFAECDDAGVGTCSDTATFPGGGVDIRNGYRYEAGNRDAGLSIIPNGAPLLFGFGSYAQASVGEYAIIAVGIAPGDLTLTEPAPSTTDSTTTNPGGTTSDPNVACTPLAVTIAETSSVFDNRYQAENMLDGNSNTSWSSTRDDSAPYVVFDFGATTSISGFLIDGSSSIAGFEADALENFQFSTPARRAWEVVFEGTLPFEEGSFAFTFDSPVVTEQIALDLISNYGGDYFEITDIVFCE